MPIHAIDAVNQADRLLEDATTSQALAGLPDRKEFVELGLAVTKTLVALGQLTAVIAQQVAIHDEERRGQAHTGEVPTDRLDHAIDYVASIRDIVAIAIADASRYRSAFESALGGQRDLHQP